MATLNYSSREGQNLSMEEVALRIRLGIVHIGIEESWRTSIHPKPIEYLSSREERDRLSD